MPKFFGVSHFLFNFVPIIAKISTINSEKVQKIK